MSRRAPVNTYLMHMFISSHAAKPQWAFMHGLMENAIYGGRVDNTFDMRVLISYLEQCFNDIAITGQAATPTRTGKKIIGLPFGNIPVSLRTQVRLCITIMHCRCDIYTILYNENIFQSDNFLI